MGLARGTESALIAATVAGYLVWTGIFLFLIDPLLRRGVGALLGARINLSWTTILWEAPGISLFSLKGLAMALVQLVCFGVAALGPIVLAILVHRRLSAL